MFPSRVSCLGRRAATRKVSKRGCVTKSAFFFKSSESSSLCFALFIVTDLKDSFAHNLAEGHAKDSAVGKRQSSSSEINASGLSLSPTHIALAHWHSRSPSLRHDSDSSGASSGRAFTY
jgi:hypothetical protein